MNIFFVNIKQTTSWIDKQEYLNKNTKKIKNICSYEKKNVTLHDFSCRLYSI